MKNKLYSVLLIIIVALGQCKDPYEFDTFDRPGLVVVSGYIGDLPGPYPLFLGITQGAKRTYPSPLLNAKAYVMDDQGNSENYIEKGNGNYELPGNFITGKQGSSYRLFFTLEDGRSYQSTLELMPIISKASDEVNVGVVTVKVLGYEGIQIDRIQMNVNINTVFEGQGTGFYRWSVDEVYSIFPTCFPGAISCPPICYIQSPYSLYHLNVVNRSDYSVPSISGIQLLNRDIDFTFSSRHYFNVTQYGMNSSCFNYWKKVQQLVSKSGSIFDTPPAIIQGNVQNVSDPNEIVLGYFEASSIQITRKFIDRGQIPVFIQSCVVYDADYTGGLSYCSNCLILPGSDSTPPKWFW